MTSVYVITGNNLVYFSFHESPWNWCALFVQILRLLAENEISLLFEVPVEFKSHKYLLYEDRFNNQILFPFDKYIRWKYVALL